MSRPTNWTARAAWALVLSWAVWRDTRPAPAPTPAPPPAAPSIAQTPPAESCPDARIDDLAARLDALAKQLGRVDRHTTPRGLPRWAEP